MKISQFTDNNNQRIYLNVVVLSSMIHIFQVLMSNHLWHTKFKSNMIYYTRFCRMLLRFMLNNHDSWVPCYLYMWHFFTIDMTYYNNNLTITTTFVIFQIILIRVQRFSIQNILYYVLFVEGVSCIMYMLSSRLIYTSSIFLQHNAKRAA